MVDNDRQTVTPANLTAAAGAGVGEVVLAWDRPAPQYLIRGHEYRYKTDGAYPDEWTEIPTSGQGFVEGEGANLAGWTVTGLVGGQAHTFQVRTVYRNNDGDLLGNSAASNEDGATPRSAAVSFGAETYAVAEGESVEVTVALDGAPGREVVVPVSAAPAGGATAQGETGADWSGVPPTVTFAATDTAQTFTLTATDDTDDDDGESVALSFRTLPAGVEAGTPSAATVTIEDDDLPVVTIAADDTVITEEQDAEFTLSRTGLTAAALTVAVAVRQQAERDLLPDGAAANRTVTFAADAATAALTVELEKDTLRELAGDLTVEVQEGTGYTVGDPSRAVVPVRDADQGAPLTPQGLTAEAGARAGAVVLAWTAPAPHLVYDRHEYRYKTDGAYGSWRSIPNSGRTPTVEGANLAGYTVTGLAGGQEHTFQVRARISYGSAPSVNVYSDASNEDSATPRSAAVTLHLSGVTEEGAALEDVGTVTVTATVTPASATAFTVTVTASPVAPATSDDFTLSADTVLSFAAGATESTGTVTIRVVDDDDPEPHDVVTVSGSVSDAAVTAPDDVTLTIVNDDLNVRYDITVEAPATVAEDAGTAEVTVTLTTHRERGPGGRGAGALFRAAGADGGGRRRLHLAGDGCTRDRDRRGGVGFLAECRRNGLGDGGQLHDRHRRRRPG